MNRDGKPMKPSTREAWYGYFLASPWIIGFIVFTVGPMLASLIIGLYRTDFLTETTFVGLRWYQNVLSDSLVRKALIKHRHLQLFRGADQHNSRAADRGDAQSGHPPAKLLAHRLLPPLRRVRRRGVAAVEVALPARHRSAEFDPRPLAASLRHRPAPLDFSTEWALPSLIIMAFWGAGGAMLIYLAGLRGIPTSLYEAAEIDGASSFRRFFAVTLPLLTPTIFFNVVLNIIGSWQVFTQAMVMTRGGPNNATLTMVLHIYNTGFQNFYFGYASAQAWFLFVIVLISSFWRCGARLPGCITNGSRRRIQSF